MNKSLYVKVTRHENGDTEYKYNFCDDDDAEILSRTVGKNFEESYKLEKNGIPVDDVPTDKNEAGTFFKKIIEGYIVNADTINGKPNTKKLKAKLNSSAVIEDSKPVEHKKT